jgi:hypothetical protein
VDARTGLISTLSGSAFAGSKPLEAVLPLPRLLFSDPQGNLYVLDKAGVHYMDFSKLLISTIAGTTAGFSGDGGPAVRAQLYYPNSLAFDSKGNLYLADSSNNRIRRIDASTGIITTVAGNGKGPPPYTGGVITLQQ